MRQIENKRSSFSGMHSGKVELILGPMFAGKSTELIDRVERSKLAGLSCLVIKYSKDTRYSEERLATHDEVFLDALPLSELMPSLPTALGYNVIAIDEGQFFPDIVPFSLKLAEAGRSVIIAALDGTFERKPFGSVLNLLTRADTIDKLLAVCESTGSEAPFSKRICQSKEVELIGGSESYVAASRSVFNGIEKPGQIELICGPVRSGKSSSLIRKLNRFKFANRKALLISTVESKGRAKVMFESMTTDALPDVNDVSGYNAIGIDNAESYNNLAAFADELANRGVHVYVSASFGNYDSHPAEEIIKLFPLCEKVAKHNSVCHITGNDAPFSLNLSDGKSIPVSRHGLTSRRAVESLVC